MLRLLWLVVFAVIVGCSQEEAAAPSANGTTTETVKELIFNTYLPVHETMRKMSVDDFSRRIEKESNGSIKVTIPGSSLAPPDRQWGAVTGQVADMAMISIYSQRAMLKLPLIADLPFASLSGESASVALWNTQQKYFSSANEFSDVKLLSMHVLPGFNYVSGVKPVNSVADFSGLKIWASAGGPSEALKAIDAIPVQTPFPALFEYVSKGNVDAALIGAGTVKSASLSDYVKYMTRIPGGMGSSSFAVVMNKDTWESLSESQQAAVLRAAEGLPARTGRALDTRNDTVLQETGLTINELNPENLTLLKTRLAGMKSAWLEAAQRSGFSQAGQAFDYYIEQMHASANKQPVGETNGE